MLPSRGGGLASFRGLARLCSVEMWGDTSSPRRVGAPEQKQRQVKSSLGQGARARAGPGKDFSGEGRGRGGWGSHSREEIKLEDLHAADIKI